MKNLIFCFLFAFVLNMDLNAQTSPNYDIYTYGQYGQKQKAATTQQNYGGGTDVYQYGQYGQKQKTQTYEDNYSGGTDVYQYGQYGQKEKIGTIQKNPY
ncbi:hypothetical protein [Aestuariivivens sediminis]|uniref:hypothetical protein n=1 Tax=Aestuariivivens sediminis TaxID=2913557 RepID=UPI001F587958|nr:hypothetical protein [Aestuariivivens sediminis]